MDSSTDQLGVLLVPGRLGQQMGKCGVPQGFAVNILSEITISANYQSIVFDPCSPFNCSITSHTHGNHESVS